MATTQQRIIQRWVAQSYNITTGAIFNYTGPNVVYDSFLSKNGTRNPGYKRRIRTALEAGTDYSVTARTTGPISGRLTGSYMLSPTNQRFRQTAFGNIGSGGNSVPTLPNRPDFSAVDIQARMGFLRKVRQARGGFQSGVFLGELRETIHTITRPGQGIRAAIDAYHRDVKKRVRGVRTARAIGKALSGSWLETSLAIKPMLMDVDDAMRTIAGSQLVYGQPLSFTAKDDTQSHESVKTCSFSGTSLSFVYTPVLHSKRLVKYKGLVAWESANLASSWRSDWGLTLRDFIPTVYEVIPYSWLVDYFSNLGEIVNGLTTGAVSLRWGSKVVVTDAKYSFENIQPRFIGGPNYRETEITLTSIRLPDIRRFDFTRNVVTSVSISFADFRLSLPGNWMQWANIGALGSLRTLFK